ncbi:DNA polymerase Y family protein [Aliirhizobium terrae]|uniref:Y-family DNA polymerase n=1 Tax=Terrirhizobium terrae TaxID=2926709 RepID=UPI002575687C|nr:DNA polymerase Y family protein [Rhizobium sp. CC-CFT758]WJH42197.1 DNA polymerase Y family protein [Rhizobium sp. CC-CFT758]
MRLTALDEKAESCGLKRGQGLAEARAMFPTVDVFDEDERADHALLEAVADWCDRYTPLVALDGKDGLFLDITGCAHLFGGEAAMLRDILARLRHMGFDVRGAISSSPGLSWAVSRFGKSGVVAREEMADVLNALPVHALRIDESTIASLCKLGLKRVADLIAMPRAPLVRRFGAQLLLRLDQARGMNEEAISPRRPVAALSAERQLAEPIQAEEHILSMAGDIAASLKLSLEARGLGGRVFELVLFRVDGRVFRIAAGTSRPVRDPKRIAKLFAERLNAVHDELDAGFGFELLRLNVLQHDTLDALQNDFDGEGTDATSLSDFIDKVSARLGSDCLQVFRLRQSHIPERAEMLIPAISAGGEKQQTKEAHSFIPRSDRPLRLLRHPERMESFAATIPDGPPQRFRWRHVVHDVIRAEGPERISPEWWLDDDATEERDYFRLESDTGRLFWIFRLGRYNIDRPAIWRMHGFFA